ncbi:MAG: hypothetical protein ACK5JT_11235, partial [Hyphomicrobiaceae bacterium]
MTDNRNSRRQAPAAGEAPAPPKPQTTSGAMIGQASPGQVGAVQLLTFESRIRAAKDETELLHVMANECRKLLAARQVIILKRGRRGKYHIKCVSSTAVI